MASKKSKSSASAALTATQTSARDNMMSITGCSSEQAVRFLTSQAWSSDGGIGAFFESGEAPQGTPAAGGGGGGSSSSSASASSEKAKVEAYFAKYECLNAAGEPQGYIWDSEPVTHPERGFVRFFQDLGIDPESDDLLLYILFKCEREQPKDKRDMTMRMLNSRLLREEFLLGMQRMGVSSAEGLRSRLPALRKEMEEREPFRRFWDFCYRYHCELLEKEGLQNSPSKEVCVAVARMVLGNPAKPHRAARFPMLASFLEYVEGPGVKGTLKRDDWQLMLTFGEKVAADLSNYDPENNAWTSLFDEYREWLEAKGAAGGAAGAGGGGGGGH